MRTPVRRAFTLVELLVVIGVIAAIIGLLIPAMKSARESAGESTCANNLRQLGVATLSYLSAYKEHLPQTTALNPFTNEVEVIGALFGGKRGELAMFEIDQIGADKRPLNKFLAAGGAVLDPDPSDGYHQEDVPAFRCPLDRGQPAQPPFLPQVDVMYDFVGNSYTLNDHTLESENCTTLVPKRTGADPGNGIPGKPGGRMPSVADPTKTWMLADIPVYNYQEGGDRQQKWHFHGVRCNMCFVDGHVASGIDMEEGVVNTTKKYTFLPDPKWIELHCPGIVPP